MVTAITEEIDAVTYAQLSDIELKFDQVDEEIRTFHPLPKPLRSALTVSVRRQHVLSHPLYLSRAELTSKIPGFWPLVFEYAPPDIDRYIQPSDSEIFAKCLTNFSVSRFELDPTTGLGEPKSLMFRFEFDKSQNDWFEDEVLEKKFWHRRSRDGWEGLVSKPVDVRWKKGKDSTQGLLKAAVKLWKAREKFGEEGMSKRDLKEWDNMAKLTQTWNGDNTSFFTWFGFVSSLRWIGEEENKEAVRKMEERNKRSEDRASKGKGKAVEEEEEWRKEPEAFEDEYRLNRSVEVHEYGEELATVLAEDLWPEAIKYFSKFDHHINLNCFKY